MRFISAKVLVARAIRNAIRANRFARIIRNRNPYFYSASGRFARITRISDSRESPDSIHANHATKAKVLNSAHFWVDGAWKCFRAPSPGKTSSGKEKDADHGQDLLPRDLLHMRSWSSEDLLPRRTRTTKIPSRERETCCYTYSHDNLIVSKMALQKCNVNFSARILG